MREINAGCITGAVQSEGGMSVKERTAERIAGAVRETGVVYL